MNASFANTTFAATEADAELPVCNPLSGEQLYRITELSEAEATALMAQQRQAATALGKASVSERARELRKLRNAIAERRESIVDRVVAETGKCRTDALVSEVLGVLDYFDWLLKAGPKIVADRKVSTPLTQLGKRSLVYQEPLGVVLIIAPWNYPFHIAITAIAAALFAGNAVLFKPSELTPLQGLLEGLLEVSPLLRSAVGVAYGSGLTAQRLIAQRPAKIFFTGSARTGKHILAQAAPLLIPVELELGGKDAAIVFDDVNLERSVAGVLWGAMTNAGQSCTSIERLYVQEGIYQAFVARLKEELAKLVVNAGDAGDADIGSLTAGFQQQIVAAQIAQATQAGATVTTSDSCPPNTLFYPPTLIEAGDDELSIWHEETFGPTLAIRRFHSEDEAIQMANAGDYGLSASVWSADLKRADRVARKLEVGAVSINNVMLTEGNPALPFGGTKGSGFGRVKGAEGLLGMTRSKAVIVDKQSKKIEANWYPYTRQKYRLFGALMDALFGRGLSRWLKFAMSGMQLEAVAQKSRDQVQ